MKDLPFQLQIIYTKLDGMKCMRVISKKQPITFDRSEAEEKANIKILGLHAVQTSAKLASKGDYMKARAYNYSNKAVLSRAAAKSEDQYDNYQAWESKGRQFESEMKSVQVQEKSEGLFLDEDAEDLFEDNQEEKKEEKKKELEEKKKELSEKRNKSRKNNRSDSTADMLYKFKNLSDVSKE